MNSKIVILAIAAAAAISCTSQIIVEPEDSSVKVIMNAQLDTRYDGSVIYLSYSNVSEAKRLSGATVTVSVNGGAPVRADEAAAEDSYAKATPYCYNGQFNPGDKVRFEAKTKYGNVSSEVTVPYKVNIDKVDTLRTIVRGSGYTETNLQFKVKITDKPGESNFYRLVFFKEECYDTGGGEKESVLFRLPADGSGDPVLSEGSINTGDLLSQLLETDNSYMIFNDNTFEGESRVLRVNVNAYNLLAAFSYEYDDETRDYDDPYVYVILEHLTFEEYYYLKAMTNLDNLGYDASFFFEPTTIPSNVDNGMGFVAVSTSSDPVKIRIPDDLYLYEVRYYQEHPEEKPY